MCKHSTKFGVNPLIPSPELRPRCSVKTCDNPRAIISCLADGSPNYRKVCGFHHSKNIAEKHGLKYSKQLTAKRLGMTITEYSRQWHPYLNFRKDYCENIDGRLGFQCTTTIAWSGMLDVDHKNGNHLDNRPRNLQTLCKCCHAYKTNKKKDYLTPGRKTRMAA